MRKGANVRGDGEGEQGAIGKAFGTGRGGGDAQGSVKGCFGAGKGGGDGQGVGLRA